MTALTPTSRLMVLMFTDIVGSVDLKGRLGAAAYTDMISRHDRLFRQCVDQCAGARVIQDTGDGFLSRFETASDAVMTALRFQDGLRQIDWADVPLSVRVGLNLGQVSEVRDDSGGVKYIGLATDMAARVMSLAQGGQILMTRSIFDDARQYVREHPPRGNEEGPGLQWMAHGLYLFKGSEEPLDVYEVGAAGFAPLRAPLDSEKARRAVSAIEEETLGWRPAAGLEVPKRRGWFLVEKLGEGGFGEVWLGRHNRTKDQRVFKFCFDADRLRSFKRELTLFKLLRDKLGDRKDIAKLYEVQLDDSPYFLESEYSGYGSLSEWAEKQGGLSKIPLDLRIDMVARTADAVGAAHSSFVLHKDIKPSNILIYMSEDGVPRPRLADFGIGVVTDSSELAKRNITVTGMTEGWLEGNESSRTGTRMYAPPEILSGRDFTVRGDIYALGVFLYQMVVGDFSKPLATGWEADIEDECLREDIRACTIGDPDQRLGSAKELADRLRALPARRKALAAGRRRKLLMTGLGAAAVVTVVAGVWAVRETGLRKHAEEMRVKAEAEEKRAIEQRDRVTTLMKSQQAAATEFVTDMAKRIEAIQGATAARVMALNTAAGMLLKLGELDPADSQLQRKVAEGLVELADIKGGVRSGNLGDVDGATLNYKQAMDICEALVERFPKEGPSLHALAASRFKMADLVRSSGDNQKALSMFMRVLDEAQKAAELEWPNEADRKKCDRLAAAAELKVSDVHRQVKNSALAREYMEKTLERRRAALESNPEDETAIRDLAIGLGRQGKVFEDEKNYAGALASWRESVDLREKLAARPANEDSMRAKRDLAQGLTDYAAALNAASRNEEAIVAGRRTVEILRELIEADPIDKRLKLTMLDAQLALGATLRTGKQFQEAAKVFADNIELANSYLQAVVPTQAEPEAADSKESATPNVTAMYVRIQSYVKLGETHVNLGEEESAAEAFKAALRGVDELLAIDPMNGKVQRWREAANRELAELDAQPAEQGQETSFQPTG